MEGEAVVDFNRARVTPFNGTRYRKGVDSDCERSRHKSNSSDNGSNKGLHFSVKGVTRRYGKSEEEVDEL
jgi:hypothetical protein